MSCPIERCSDHWKIISVAGWSYRINDRGWIIYRDPQTGRWHTCAEAMTIIEAVASIPAALRAYGEASAWMAAHIVLAAS
jgi:hypothetical protein